MRSHINFIPILHKLELNKNPVSFRNNDLNGVEFIILIPLQYLKLSTTQRIR